MDHGFRSIPKDRTDGVVEVALDIWTIEAEGLVYFRPPMQPKYPYTYRSTVIRLRDGGLFVISPIALTSRVREAINALGSVKYIVSPNAIHHLHMGDWSTAYPEAKLYASPRLQAKRGDLSFDRTLSTNTPDPEWAGQIDQCVFGSDEGRDGPLDEIVFYHRASSTAIFTDLIMDFDPSIFSPLARITTRWNQMYRHTPRGIQLANMFSRRSLRRALAIARAWEPERLIVAHSPWLCVSGRQCVTEVLEQAFDWLTPHHPVVEALLTAGRVLGAIFVVLPIHFVVVLVADVVYPRMVRRKAGT